MRRFLWMVAVAVLWPNVAVGGSCSDFPWHYPRDMVMPLLIANGQVSAEDGFLLEAREYFSTYLLERQEGVFADGARWMLAYLPESTDEPRNAFLAQIKRLEAMKAEHPDSVYAPWALCSMGKLYWDAEWHSEASALFEEFLQAYPNHPLAGGVMIEVGLGFLEKQQFLEAALILRRVVEEPKWEAYRLKGALGLAEATAMSKVWKQSNYWYRVVEAENPDLIRRSESSSYYYGLTELEAGDSQKAISRFLDEVNLHPQKEFAGQALIRISEKLLKDGHEYLSLWFADEARRRFPDKEIGRRGQAAQIRWVVNFLSKDHSEKEWEQMYKRMNEVDVYVSVSWDNVVETARMLSGAPEPEVVEESLLWMGRGYLMIEDRPAAIRSFTRLAVVASSQAMQQEVERGLSAILNKQIASFSLEQDWVRLLKFQEDQREAFQFVPLTRERVTAVAQAYWSVNLPSKAMQWYDQLLQDHPDSPLREEILAQKVLLAEDQSDGQMVQDAGGQYVQEYPQGRWRDKVSTILGVESLGRQDYPRAIEQLTDVLGHTPEQSLKRYVLRNRALAYQETGEWNLARQDLQQVVALDQLDMANVVRLGDFLFEQGDFSEAEPLYDQVLAADVPEALKAWVKYRWGLSLDYQGKADEAQQLLGEVRQLETQSPEFENTIRAAAVAVLDEFSLREEPRIRSASDGG